MSSTSAPTMKAVVFDRFGPPEVLRVALREKPLPKNGEMLVRVRAANVTSGDCRIRSQKTPRGFGLPMKLIFGFRKPRNPVLGWEFCGVVEALGPNVSRFAIGDIVMGIAGMSMGCHAQYKCIRAAAPIVRKPENLSDVEAACLCFGGGTALHFLNRAKMTPGQSILVNGASGAVGSALVQLARHRGLRVTGVCSGRNADLVRALGADAVIDYSSTDLLAHGQTYDAVADTVGNLDFGNAQKLIRPGGKLLLIVADLPQTLAAPWQSRTSGVAVIAGVAGESLDVVQTLAKWAEQGIYKPVVDRTFAMEDVVAAHRYAESGHKRGSAVLTIDP